MAEKRNSKALKRATTIAQFVGDNIAALRDWKFAQLPNVTARNKALGKAAGDYHLPQVQRIIKAEVHTGIDTIERFAAVFGIKPSDLLVPYFGQEFVRNQSGRAIEPERRALPGTLELPRPILQETVVREDGPQRWSREELQRAPDPDGTWRPRRR